MIPPWFMSLSKLGSGFAAVILFLCCLAPGRFAFAADTRPNILLCIADDWGWPDAGAYGETALRTPTFDRLASEGVLFTHCFSSAPSCSPSRSAILTGQYPHRLEEGGVLWGFLPRKFLTYPELLENAGYTIGFTRKGWGPGRHEAGGYSRNPAGPRFRSFEEFLGQLPSDAPFCFWFGSNDPHRPYDRGSGRAAGLDPVKVTVPPYLPDNGTTRDDLLDYYHEVERFDREVASLLEVLDKSGRLQNTIVVMTADNGRPFPRCKANLYDGGTRQPLVVRWPAAAKSGSVFHDFVNLMDLAPTFLEAAGLQPPPEMTGHSLHRLLLGLDRPGRRSVVFLERERHANVREGGLGYPMRAIRTREFLYIRNFHPGRWPAGDPEPFRDPFERYGDVDHGPTKTFILDHSGSAGMEQIFEWCFGKRPSEELYDVRKDPHQLKNLATQPEFGDLKQRLRKRLLQWMKVTTDPRSSPDAEPWDSYPYFGGHQAR